jgi:hypothetical protein
VPAPRTTHPKDTVTFTTSHRTSPTGVVMAQLKLVCNGQLKVTVDGQPLHVTLDPGTWSLLVNEIADAAH